MPATLLKMKYSKLQFKLIHTNFHSCQILQYTVCNFQSMKSSVELNSLLSKFFCYITWFVISLDWTRLWTTCQRGLYRQSYCFLETIAQRFKNYKLNTQTHLKNDCKGFRVFVKLQARMPVTFLEINCFTGGSK